MAPHHALATFADILRDIQDALRLIRKALRDMGVEESDPVNAPIFKPLRLAERRAMDASRRLDAGLIVTDVEVAEIQQLFAEIKAAVI